jgi:hypothetical protein
MAKEKPTCPVCLDNFTQVIRQPIQCAYCPYSTCRQCTSQYLLSTLNDPHCMQCKREWNREFIDTKLTQTFRKGSLKLHRRRVLMDRERGRLPAMQVFAEAQNIMIRVMEESSALRKQRKALKIQRNEIQVQYGNEGVDALAARLGPIQKQLYEMKARIRALEREGYNARRILVGEERVETRQFIMKCPGEACRGFLSSAWKCGTCEKFFCSDCHAQKEAMRDEGHVCNEDAKATASLIRQETKPCPKCGIRISKIDGCDQMWCTECQTTFSWNSGQILLNTVVHNPHYYEYLRKTNGAIPREAGDIPCGGLPMAYVFTRLVYDIPPLYLNNEKKACIVGALRGISDIFHMRLPQFPLRQAANMNRDIDISYLLNKITEEEWGTRLEHMETQFERKKEIGLILQTLVHIGSEKLTSLQNQLQTTANMTKRAELVLQTIEEMEEVREYINSALKRKGVQMGMVVPQITKLFVYNWSTRQEMKVEKQNEIIRPPSQPPLHIARSNAAAVVQEPEEKEDKEEEEDEKITVEIDGEMIEMSLKQAKEILM